MTIPDSKKLYPRTGDRQTIYLKNAVQNPRIEVGDFIEGSGEKRVFELLPRMNRLEKNRGSMLLCAEGLITYLYYPKAAELSAMVS